MIGGDDLQNGVSEKFETLVVGCWLLLLRGVGRMGEGFHEQGGVLEMISRVLLNLFKKLRSFIGRYIEFFHKRIKLKLFRIGFLSAVKPQDRCFG